MIKGIKSKVDLFTAAFILISLIGIIVRVWSFGSIPPGLNADEASVGYDAYSIMNYGIDRNGAHNPVHLIAWGSGQNAFYAYLSMPFIYLFGLTPFSIRLPNLVFGILSLFIFYKLVKAVSNREIALTAFFLLAINPWHIMLSRWALESNIFPAVFLIGIYLMVLSIEKKKLLPLSFLFFALSLYCYGTSYFFMPVLLVAAAAYFLYHKKITLMNLLISSLVFLITAAPIILFVLINYFKWDSIDLLLFTIPRLTGDAQYMTQSALFQKDFLNNVWHNFVFFLRFFVSQEDVLWNVIPKFGFMYLVSLPFAIIGFVRLLKTQFSSRKFRMSFIFLIWLFASILLTFAVEICTNRINIIFLPVIFLVSVGIYHLKNRLRDFPVSPLAVTLFIIEYAYISYTYRSLILLLFLCLPLLLFATIRVSRNTLATHDFSVVLNASAWLSVAVAFLLIVKFLPIRMITILILLIAAFITVFIVFQLKNRVWQFTAPLLGIYVVLFSMFSYNYFTLYPENISALFYESFGEAINYASENTDGDIHVTDKANMPYIFVLFYQKTDPNLFQNTVVYVNPGGSFQNVLSFDRYSFGDADPGDPKFDAFVVHHSDIAVFDDSIYNIKDFKLYSVAIRKD